MLQNKLCERMWLGLLAAFQDSVNIGCLSNKGHCLYGVFYRRIPDRLQVFDMSRCELDSSNVTGKY